MTSWLEGVGIALASLRAHKLRAGLTILGVAIGVTVVMVIGALISGFNQGVSKELRSLGPQTFYVGRYWGGTGDEDPEDPNPWRRRPAFTLEEATRLEELPSIKFVVVDENAAADIEFEDRRVSGISIQGRDADWPKIEGGDLRPGRSFSDFEDRSNSPVVVVNDELVEQLFGERDPIGRRIRIAGLPFEVIGVYNAPPELFGQPAEPEAIIPYGTLVKYIPYWHGWLDLFVIPEDTVPGDRALDDGPGGRRAMRVLRPAEPNNFDVVTQDRYLEAVDNITRLARILMFALSSVGLMVGGIGVVAIMMISVTERTREIGVRKALGATRREILWQFLVEAATLTLVGGVVGMLMGGGVSLLIAVATTIPTYVPLGSVVVALGAAIVTGIVFGIYPATQAARLDPVEALRYE